MSYSLLVLLDYFFLIFHSVFTLFNITGWLWKKTRKIHMVTILLTTLSWFVLGIWYGFGYCFCTDWHWQVREHLGTPAESSSYIHFLILETTGIDMSLPLVDKLVLIIFLCCLVLTVFLNYRDYKLKKASADEE